MAGLAYGDASTVSTVVVVHKIPATPSGTAARNALQGDFHEFGGLWEVWFRRAAASMIFPRVATFWWIFP